MGCTPRCLRNWSTRAPGHFRPDLSKEPKNPCPSPHTTRRGKVYYLHTGPKRGGGVQHFLSQDSDGDLVDVVPQGFEVHETVNGQVYLRRARPPLILEAELECVRHELAMVRGPNLYAAEVNRNIIVVHESTGNFDFTTGLGALRTRSESEAIARRHASYMPMMRFVLQDKARRVFLPQRYCFRGSVDDWIAIGAPDEMESLVAKFIPHLGRDSFYELY